VVEGVEQDAAAAQGHLLHLAVDAGDPELLAGQKLRREVAEGRHHLRLDELDLAKEMALAGLDLVRHRVTVPRRTTFQDVGDKDHVPGEVDPGEQLIEELPRLADEREALLVLVKPGRLPDEHQVRIGGAVAEDNLRPAFREAAPGAGRGLRRVSL
jgi:hypothetical protein